MIKIKFHRVSLFFFVVIIVFLWDFALSQRFLDPENIPHPFALIEAFGSVEFLRGFGWFLRRMLLFWLVGLSLGLVVASLIRRRFSLTHSILKFLRIGLWFPFLLIFATPGVFFLGITTVLLASCYHYLLARTRFNLPRPLSSAYVIRETLFQALLFSLVAEIWFPTWMLFKFPQMNSTTIGLGVNAIIIVLIISVTLLFKVDFKRIASLRGEFLKKESAVRDWRSSSLALLWGVLFFVVWFGLSSLGFIFYRSSPFDVIDAAVRLFASGEIYMDIAMTLAEVVTGILLGGFFALCATPSLRAESKLGNQLHCALSLGNAYPIALWLLCFFLMPLPLFLGRALLIALLTFYPLIETFFALSNTTLLVRLLSGIESSLPVAFLAALVGEAYAGTAGIGFLMVVASATFQTYNGLVGVFTTVILLGGLSALCRVIVRREIDTHRPEALESTFRLNS